ncbi:MAG: phosphatase PAP2 family protein [Pyrinomonadaceae bacterium MAG19_C2-C3]|nr:phosphatase PAP2 family protein [Pyrinomonadaceae bacterium MAG19_C2-C3]
MNNPETPSQPHEAATPTRRQAARRLLFIQPVFATALVAFAVLAVGANFYAYFTWDLIVTRFIQSLDAPLMLTLMRLVSLPGNGATPYIIAVATIVLFFVFNRRSEAAALTLSVGGGGLLNSLLKALIQRPRPVDSLVTVSTKLGTQSFPSGHVTFYVCFSGFLFFVAYALLPARTYRRTLALILTALPVLLVGLSRIYLGAHWASDTLGAYLFGGVWLAFSLEMYRRWKARATFHINKDG